MHIPVAVVSLLLTVKLISVDDLLLSISINITIDASSTLYDDLLNSILTAVMVNKMILV